jgi:hypothetical protein
LSPTDTLLVNVVAGLLAAESPYLLKFARREGLTMAQLSFALALVVAVAVSILTGEASRLSWGSAQTVLLNAAWLWSLQQGAYHVIRAALPGSLDVHPVGR